MQKGKTAKDRTTKARTRMPAAFPSLVRVGSGDISFMEMDGCDPPLHVTLLCSSQRRVHVYQPLIQHRPPVARWRNLPFCAMPASKATDARQGGYRCG